MFCESALGQVHCVVAGEGAGAPLLLLHQTPRSTDEFAEVLPLLARQRRVIAIDTPGYGCSDRVPGQPSIADYAGAAIDVLDALGIEQATVVGHHTGAVIAVELAAAFSSSGPCGRTARTWSRSGCGCTTGCRGPTSSSGSSWTCFAPCRVASIEAGIFAANERPDVYAQAVLDYLSGPP